MKSLLVLFELKSLFLDFGMMEKMVGLSFDQWWYEDGGIVYQKKKRRRRRRWWYEDRGVIWFPLMKRVVASSIKRCVGVMLL